jgi:hypothetical protein
MSVQQDHTGLPPDKPVESYSREDRPMHEMRSYDRRGPRSEGGHRPAARNEAVDSSGESEKAPTDESTSRATPDPAGSQAPDVTAAPQTEGESNE